MMCADAMTVGTDDIAFGYLRPPEFGTGAAHEVGWVSELRCAGAVVEVHDVGGEGTSAVHARTILRLIAEDLQPFLESLCLVLVDVRSGFVGRLLVQVEAVFARLVAYTGRFGLEGEPVQRFQFPTLGTADLFHASYYTRPQGCCLPDGADDRIRTGNLLHGKQVLHC